MFISVYISICYIYMYIFMYINTYAHIYICINIYICIYTSLTLRAPSKSIAACARARVANSRVAGDTIQSH